MTDTNSGLSRRTLAKGAAWAVPAVAVAAAAPAMAASYYVTIEQTGPACKLPGGSCEQETGIKFGYTQPVRVCTNVPATVTVTFPSPQYILINNVSVPYSVVTGPASGNNPPITTLTITGTGVRCVNLNIYLSTSDSAESSLSGTLLSNWTAVVATKTVTGSSSTPLSASTTPPCVKCLPPAPTSGKIAMQAEVATSTTTKAKTNGTTSTTTTEAPGKTTVTDEATTTSTTTTP